MTKQEALKIKSYLVKTAIKTLGITERQASLRIDAIIESGILSKFGDPESTAFKIAIDAAMQIPQLSDERIVYN